MAKQLINLKNLANIIYYTKTLLIKSMGILLKQIRLVKKLIR